MIKITNANLSGDCCLYYKFDFEDATVKDAINAICEYQIDHNSNITSNLEIKIDNLSFNDISDITDYVLRLKIKDISLSGYGHYWLKISTIKEPTKEKERTCKNCVHYDICGILSESLESYYEQEKPECFQYIPKLIDYFFLENKTMFCTSYKKKEESEK